MATYTFQEGIDSGEGVYSGTKDTFLNTTNADQVYGHYNDFQIHSNTAGGGSPQWMFSLIRFEDIFVSDGGPISDSSVITSATLTYWVNNPCLQLRAYVFECLVDWEDDVVTYNNFSTATQDGIQPQDYGDFVAFAPTPGADYPNEYSSSINVTASLSKWRNYPSKNKGWIIFAADDDVLQITSGAKDIPAHRPILTVVVDEGITDNDSAQLERQPYIQNIEPDGVHVLWRTDAPSMSYLHHGASSGNLDTTVSSSALVQNHNVTITGLSADTTYYYDVGTITKVLAGGDANHYFKTAPTLGATSSFSFWALGDSGTGGSAQRLVHEEMVSYVATLPEFMLFLGDIYPSGKQDTLTDHFFSPYRETLRRSGSYLTLGAHEAVYVDADEETGAWFDANAFPSNMERGYYSFNYGNAHFISLNPNASIDAGSDQLDWLDDDLAAIPASIDWLIAFNAYPPHSAGTHLSDNSGETIMKQLRENALAPLEAAGLDLFLSGHSHGFERSFLIKDAYSAPGLGGGTKVDDGDGDSGGDGSYTKSTGLNDDEGAVYIVSGNGGVSASNCPYGHPLMYADMAVGDSETQGTITPAGNGCTIVTINNQTLSCVHMRDDGVIVDEFQIVKS